MKNLPKTVVLSLILLFAFSGLCFAESNFSMKVSCSIPSVPGLNAPLIEENTTQSEDSLSTQQAQLPQEENNSSKNIIQTGTEKEIKLAENNAQAVTLHTIYSR